MFDSAGVGAVAHLFELMIHGIAESDHRWVTSHVPMVTLSLELVLVCIVIFVQQRELVHHDVCVIWQEKTLVMTHVMHATFR